MPRKVTFESRTACSSTRSIGLPSAASTSIDGIDRRAAARRVGLDDPRLARLALEAEVIVVAAPFVAAAIRPPTVPARRSAWLAAGASFGSASSDLAQIADRPP